MSTSSFRSLRTFWEECFRYGLTRPGYNNLVVVLAGWLLTQGPHAITEALVATGVSGRRHWEAFHRLFSRGTWSPDVLGRNVFLRIERHLGAETLRIVIDDTVTPKKGPKVFGLGCHIDAVRSTKRWRTFTFGHLWVVLAVVVRLPFSQRTWALPVLFRLYRNVAECERNQATYKRKTDLAREMLEVLLGWAGERRIELAADLAYCNDTVTRGLPERVVIFGAMRPDAVLTEVPSGAGGRKGGRPRKRGQVLRKPQKLANDGRSPWQTTKAELYGQPRTVRYKTVVAQWYRATGTRILKIVVVECDSGSAAMRVFFSSDPSLDIATILETYSGRWGIEVFFRDAKQLLGFADSKSRKKEAVLRIAPVIGLLYSVLVLWFTDGRVRQQAGVLPERPWYPHKRGFAFTDILRAARRTLAGVDVLVPFSDSEHLREPLRPPKTTRKRAA